VDILIAGPAHTVFAEEISEAYSLSAKVRGTGIAQRSAAYIRSRMEKGDAVIALDQGQFAGFCYIEVWGDKDYVANSGLLVQPAYRGQGLARQLKSAVFDLSRDRYPEAKIFGITTGLAVMKLNSSLGYRPVTFSELTEDPEFWKGCQTCRNYDVLVRTEKKMCLCTGMLYDPKEKPQQAQKTKDKAFKRLIEIKKKLFLKKNTAQDEKDNSGL
jgi:GNAT superfamily N-acetyltransferase